MKGMIFSEPSGHFNPAVLENISDALDASRKIHAGGEFATRDTENSKQVCENMTKGLVTTHFLLITVAPVFGKRMISYKIRWDYKRYVSALAAVRLGERDDLLNTCDHI